MFSISRMQQLLKPLPRGQFDKLVARHGSDRHSKGFGSWDQLLAMLTAQLSGAHGLRQAVMQVNSQQNHHYHLGTREVKRSTLADANAKRPSELFADVARALMAQLDGRTRRDCGELLYLLDSTSITLKGREFDRWTLSNRTRNTQGVKLHLMYDAGAQAPAWHSITAANVNDRDEGVCAPIRPGATYVFDKGYCDYNWWAGISEQGARLVTRFKRNAALRVEREIPIQEQARDCILSDQVVRLAHRHPGGKRRNACEQPLRRIEVARPGDTPLVLATNDLGSPAQRIAELYRDRWQIELFFKWIKQHLNIRRFMGRSETAVQTQILIALIAYLLIALYRQSTAATASMWEVLMQLRATLFERPSTQQNLYKRRRQDRAAFQAAQPSLWP